MNILMFQGTVQYCMIIISVIPYEPPSCLLPPQANTTPSHPKLFLSNICKYDTYSSVSTVSAAWLCLFHKILQCKRRIIAANYGAHGPHKAK
jgi:hypothetical protein